MVKYVGELLHRPVPPFPGVDSDDDGGAHVPDTRAAPSSTRGAGSRGRDRERRLRRRRERGRNGQPATVLVHIHVGQGAVVADGAGVNAAGLRHLADGGGGVGAGALPHQRGAEPLDWPRPQPRPHLRAPLQPRRPRPARVPPRRGGQNHHCRDQTHARRGPGSAPSPAGGGLQRRRRNADKGIERAAADATQQQRRQQQQQRRGGGAPTEAEEAGGEAGDVAGGARALHVPA